MRAKRTAAIQIRTRNSPARNGALVPCRIKARARFAHTSLLVLVLSQAMLGQKPGPAGTASPDLAERIAQAVRVEHPPRLDGTLDDPAWQQAFPITDFKQREPYEGQPATERTEVKVL